MPWAQERFCLCMAPANLRSPASAAALMLYAKKYAARQPVSADITYREKMPTTPEELCELEAVHQVLCHKLRWIDSCSELPFLSGLVSPVQCGTSLCLQAVLAHECSAQQCVGPMSSFLGAGSSRCTACSAWCWQCTEFWRLADRSSLCGSGCPIDSQRSISPAETVPRH